MRSNLASLQQRNAQRAHAKRVIVLTPAQRAARREEMLRRGLVKPREGEK